MAALAAIYVAVTPFGSRNHIAYSDKKNGNHRYTWCGIRIPRLTKRVQWEKLEGGRNIAPVTCRLCLSYMQGKALNQYGGKWEERHDNDDPGF